MDCIYVYSKSIWIDNMVPGDLNNEYIKRRHAPPIYFTRAREKVGRPSVHAQVSRFWSYNQLQKYLRRCTVFWHKWPVHELVLVIPPPPLIKVASNTRPYSKLGGTTLNGREEGSITSHRPVTRSDLKQGRSFFRGSVSTFLQLVVAFNQFHLAWACSRVIAAPHPLLSYL